MNKLMKESVETSITEITQEIEAMLPYLPEDSETHQNLKKALYAMINASHTVLSE